MHVLGLVLGWLRTTSPRRRMLKTYVYLTTVNVFPVPRPPSGFVTQEQSMVKREMDPNRVHFTSRAFGHCPKRPPTGQA